MQNVARFFVNYTCAALACLALLAGQAVRADDYPTRPIKLLVGAPPGGTTDTIARAIAGPMSAALKPVPHCGHLMRLPISSSRMVSVLPQVGHAIDNGIKTPEIISSPSTPPRAPARLAFVRAAEIPGRIFATRERSRQPS